MISFHFCNKKNVYELRDFLKNNWKKNYILAKNKKLLNWQHFSQSNNRYNFIIAKYNLKVVGCLGLIVNSKFSKKLISNDTIWLVNWLILKEIKISGLDFLSFLIKHLKYKKIGTVGGNTTTIEILKLLGFKTGKLNHFFMINKNITNFKLIAVNKNTLFLSKTSLRSKNHKIKKLNSNFRLKVFGKDLQKLVKKFGKDETYFIKRYILHPYYKYEMHWIYSWNNNLLGFFVIRVSEHKKRKALRIVDFFGHENALIKIAYPLRDLLNIYEAEYIDFYEYGIDNLIMKKSGLYKNTFDKKIVIPNYFEPFIKKNINLTWALKSDAPISTLLFKGDCDQDRPSEV